MSDDRVTRDDKNELDEIVVTGIAHLERMDRNKWFLSLTRKDGSSVCVWFSGKIELVEERQP